MTTFHIYVVSAHPQVVPGVYHCQASPSRSRNVLPKKMKLVKGEEVLSTEYLIRESQKLLYESFCVEMNWRPGSNTPTRFRMKEGRLTDRFDQVGLWACAVVPATGQVVAVARTLYGALNDEGSLSQAPECPQLDLTGYSLPTSFRQYLIEKGPKNTLETQRFVVSQGYRKQFLLSHLIYATYSTLYDKTQTTICLSKDAIVASTAHTHTVKMFARLVNSAVVPGWKVQYDPQEEFTEIYLTNAHSVTRCLEKFFKSSKL